MAFSATDAAFEGFRLARRRPLTVVALSVLTLVTSLLTYWIMDASGYMDAVNSMNAAGPSADPAQAMALLRPMFTFLIGIAVVGSVATAIQAGAIYRGVLRPQEHGFLGLAFGADELRLLGLAIIIVLLAGVAYFASIIVFAILLGIAGAATGLSGGNPAGMIIAVTVGIVAILAGFIALGTKMSLAGPATLDRRRLVVFGSWTMTKGNFWNLVACYFLAFILAMLIGFIMFVVALIVASTVTGVPFVSAAGEFFQRAPGAKIELFSPVRIVYTVISSLFGGLMNMVVMAPAAEAYRQICRPGEAQAETFS